MFHPSRSSGPAREKRFSRENPNLWFSLLSNKKWFPSLFSRIPNDKFSSQLFESRSVIHRLSFSSSFIQFPVAYFFFLFFFFYSLRLIVFEQDLFSANSKVNTRQLMCRKSFATRKKNFWRAFILNEKEIATWAWSLYGCARVECLWDPSPRMSFLFIKGWHFWLKICGIQKKKIFRGIFLNVLVNNFKIDETF